MQRYQRLTSGDERGGIRARSTLSQRHDRKEAQEPYGDEGALDDASRDIAQSEDFVNSLEDREQHDGVADVGDDEDHLQERTPLHAGGAAATEDVVGVVQHRGVENE